MLFKLLFFIPLFLWGLNLDNLSNQRYWKILLHYKGGVSEIDSPNFFLSKNGKYSLKDELNATIFYLQHPKLEDDNSTYCRFPARREWIQSKIPNLKIIPQFCEDLETQLEVIENIKSVTLIFPTILMNSPASMFGHTLLRLDDKEGDVLNSFAINYAAQTNEKNGLVYAFKGLSGGYIGKYAIMPYYKKIAEYNDIKSRDIWEYKLNLTSQEIEKMKLHIFEIKNTYSKYYYFNKNCSYQILWLLESARPSLKLVHKFNYKTLPIDTIKEIKKNNLIVSSKFRPSKKRIILSYFNDIKHKKLALKFYKTKDINLIKNLSKKEKQYILDFAIEMVNFDFNTHKLTRKEYIKIYIPLLRQRSKLKKEPKITISKSDNPLLTHDSSKIWVYKTINNWIFGIKPAFHNIDDLNRGFVNGAYIDFFSLELNLDKLNYFYFFDIKSLTPRDEVFNPISWGVNLGFERFKDDKLYSTLKLFSGLTYQYESFLYMFNIGLNDYYKTSNYTGISIGGYLENNWEKSKMIFKIDRNFYNFKVFNNVKASYLFSFEKNLNFNIGYKKELNEEYFFTGINYYFY